MKSNELYPKNYGAWSGDREGKAPDFERCCERVWPNDGGRFSNIHRQCLHKRGFGPSEAYCKQHDPDAIKARQEAADKAYQEKAKAERPKFFANQFLAVLREIAAGHNDARALAQQAVNEFDGVQ